jgi:predicted Zn-dependent peptidase
MTGKVITLANGVRLLHIPMPHMETVSVAAFIKVGAKNETPEQNGISHFLEHMAFKGTKTKTCYEIISGVERLGADVNAYTSYDETAYLVKGRKEDLGVFVDLIGDIVQNNIFPEDEIERERGVIIQEYHSYQDDSDSITYDLQQQASYGDTSRGRKVLGEIHNIESFQREDFISYMNQYYTGANTVVGVVGKYDEQELIELVTKHFSTMPAGTSTAVAAPVLQSGVATRDDDFDQTQVMIGFPIHGFNHPDHYADMMMTALLGNGMSSPMFTEVREKRGLVYSVGTHDDIQASHGQMFIHAGTTPEHLDELFAVVCQVLHSHVSEINPIDFERARNQLLVSYQKMPERPFSLLENFAADLLHEGKQTEIQEMVDGVNRVTVEDIKAAVARLITKRPTLSMCGSGADDKYFDQLLSHLQK